MTLPTSIARFVLFETFLWCFAGHSHIQAFQDAVKLRIGGTEFRVFRENAPGQLDHIYLIHSMQW